jgi:hypothetical protein
MERIALPLVAGERHDRRDGLWIADDLFERGLRVTDETMAASGMAQFVRPTFRLDALGHYWLLADSLPTSAIEDKASALPLRALIGCS